MFIFSSECMEAIGGIGHVHKHGHCSLIQKSVRSVALTSVHSPLDSNIKYNTCITQLLY